MFESQKCTPLQVQIKNKELKDLTLCEFELIGSEVKIVIEYNEEFAQKYNLSYKPYVLNNTIIISHDFSVCRRSPYPFEIEIIVDYTKNEVYII